MAGAIVGLGEVLWDLLPGGKQIGGAPFNFTFHCHQLGHASVMVSRVGRDELGREIRATVHRLGLADSYLQEDPAHATGTVKVAVDERGQPAFTITPDVAFDYLAWHDELGPLLQEARAVCFGTLGQRQPSARAAIQRAIRAARDAIVIFDVNLRQHYYDRAVIETSLAASRWVKLNDQELPVLTGLLALAGTTSREQLEALRQRFDLKLAILTRGARGCVVQSSSACIDVPGVAVEVVDTVGAGDAFTASLLACILEGRSLDAAARFANQLAARVAASAGATPLIDRATIG